MRKAGVRDQGSGIENGELAARVFACAVPMCEGLAMDGKYCNRCREEIEALRLIAARKDERREARRVRRAARRTFAGACAAVARRLWIVNVAVIGGVLVYLGYVWGGALIDWLQLGGWQ